MFNTLDWIIVGIYCIGIISLATYVSRTNAGKARSAEDYFLAGRSLPWWAIGASLIACLLFTSPVPRDRTRPRMPSSA